MGIKHFWGWFKVNFGKNIKSMKKYENFKSNNIGVNIDNLMIDCNGLFHSSTQKVYEYGSHKPAKRLMKSRSSNNGKPIDVFEDVCKNIEDILRIVKPSKRLILCVDGPAPLSKQNQQRQRRFKSASEKDDEEFKNFDSNCLTPGTDFMDCMSVYIDRYIRENITNNSLWSNIEVIFSSEKVPGEGEHKCINYIRIHGDIFDTYCIHGLDADLIMLALGTYLPKFWILRDDLYDSKNAYFVIDIGTIRKNLILKMRWDVKDKKFDSRYSVNDFIFMCFMVGNDFLPHIPSLEIITGGIDTMIDIYKNVAKSYGHLTVISNGNVIIQLLPLEVFLGTISIHEKKMFENKLLDKKFFKDEILENNSTYLDGKYTVNIDSFKKEYYKEKFKSPVKNVCHEYIKGLQWVISYYTKGVPDWKWCYKHHYAPFAAELADNSSTYKRDINKNVSIPTTPFQQLLSVLPPASAKLIPYPLSTLLTDKDSKLAAFCPETFKVDLSGMTREWEGTVLLPMVDFNIVEEESNKLLKLVDAKLLEKNIKGESYLYKKDNSENTVFKSIYGDIVNCAAVSEVIKL
jgi:5'-3' exonuclease